MEIAETKVNAVTTLEHIEVVIDDEKGRRVEYRPRYSVANPDQNPVRRVLADAIIARRGVKESLSHMGMASAVAAADEFNRNPNPTLDNRKHFAMCLMGAKLSREEAESIAGITDYIDRMTAAGKR